MNKYKKEKKYKLIFKENFFNNDGNEINVMTSIKKLDKKRFKKATHFGAICIKDNENEISYNIYYTTKTNYMFSEKESLTIITIDEYCPFYYCREDGTRIYRDEIV